MDAGDTFLLTDRGRALDDHLWIVVSDTKAFPDQVIIVSLTTCTPEKDQACIIQPGEHAWVRHTSCVSYFHAKVVSLETLLRLKDGGLIVLQDPLNPDVLGRIRQRSGDSTTLMFEKADILVEQGIIRLDE